MTSLPVQQRDPAPGPTKQKTCSRVRRQSSTDARSPSRSPCRLPATTSTNPREPTVMDSLLHKPSLQSDGSRSLSDPPLETDVEGPRKGCTMAIREKLLSLIQASDNKLSMNLFGNSNALVKERLRHRAANSWIIHPCSDFRSVRF